MKQRIRELLEPLLPIVDLDSEFLYSELDSLGIMTILMALSDEFKIPLNAKDATPKNFKSLDALAKMVEDKLAKNEGKA